MQRRIGVHTSIAGGVSIALERAGELGCSTVQIFSHNPRQWQAVPLPEEQASRFRELRVLYGIDPVFIHTSYLINLAARSDEILEKSLRLLVREMDLADTLGADYVVLHTGSAQDSPGEARARAVKALRRVAGEGEWKAGLLLENTAGERGDISSTIGELAEILTAAAVPLLAGVCLDTCHAFSAGYDVADSAELAAEIERNLGTAKVKLIHLNDSKRSLGARVDRHEHIGEGAIGGEGLKKFVSHPAFRAIPLVLETPKKSEDDDRRNLETVRRLLRQ
ncbi:MAG: deoxyribonuclease IV [Nitrospirales bacterium]|nr:deoxyribonuclease IV [Nitrospirales bacterium]